MATKQLVNFFRWNSGHCLSKKSIFEKHVFMFKTFHSNLSDLYSLNKLSIVIFSDTALHYWAIAGGVEVLQCCCFTELCTGLTRPDRCRENAKLLLSKTFTTFLLATLVALHSALVSSWAGGSMGRSVRVLNLLSFEASELVFYLLHNFNHFFGS